MPPAARLRHPVCPVAAPGSQSPQSLALGRTKYMQLVLDAATWRYQPMHAWRHSMNPPLTVLRHWGHPARGPGSSDSTADRPWACKILRGLQLHPSCWYIFSLLLSQIFTIHLQLKQTSNNTLKKKSIQWFIHVTLFYTQWIYGLSHELITRGISGESPMEKTLLTKAKLYFVVGLFCVLGFFLLVWFLVWVFWVFFNHIETLSHRIICLCWWIFAKHCLQEEQTGKCWYWPEESGSTFSSYLQLKYVLK